MNLPKEKLQNGDILCCTSYGWLGKQIKRFTKSTTNHTALVIKVSNVLMVIDSQKHGTNPKTFENWLAEYGYDYKVFRYRYHNVNWGKAIRGRALAKSGVTGYDFKSLLLWQPLYLITGKWHGRSKEEAEKRMYCSEFVAWVHELPNWWTMSPECVKKFCENSNFYVLINP
jgi:hypothetical protein